jgi:hypothetical protein
MQEPATHDIQKQVEMLRLQPVRTDIRRNRKIN